MFRIPIKSKRLSAATPPSLGTSGLSEHMCFIYAQILAKQALEGATKVVYSFDVSERSFSLKSSRVLEERSGEKRFSLFPSLGYNYSAQAVRSKNFPLVFRSADFNKSLRLPIACD